MSFGTTRRQTPPRPMLLGCLLAAVLVASLLPANFARAAGPAAVPLPASSPDDSRLVSGWFGWWTSPAAVESVAARGGSVMGDAMIFMWAFNGAGDPACLIDPNNGGNCAAGATTARYAQSRDSLRARGVEVYASHTDLNYNLRRQLSQYLASAGNRQAMADLLTAKAIAAGVDGVDLDWENFAFNDGSATWSDTRPRFVDAIRRLSAALHAAGKKLSVTVPAGYAPYRNGVPNDSGGYWVYAWSEIVPHVDRLRLMAYDYSVGQEGPIGPNNWAAETVRSAKAQVGAANSRKIYVGVHQYGRDWVRKRPDGSYATTNCPSGWRPNQATNSRSLSDVRQIQATHGATPNLEGTYQEWWFDYTTAVQGTAPVNGSSRQVTCQAQRRVWFGDQHTAKARMNLVGDYGIGGIATWNFGGVEGNFFSAGLAALARQVGNDTRIPAGGVLEVPVAGAQGVPPNAGAALLNLAVVAPTDPGYLTVYPCGSARPGTSALNYDQLQTISGSVLTAIGADGKVCVWTSAAAHVLVDTAGQFPTGSDLSAGPGRRLLDTRAGGMPASGAEIRVPMSDAASAAFTVTVTGSSAAGWVKAYPCDGPVPDTSVFNYGAGQTIANTVFAGLGPRGDVCLRTLTPTHLIVDFAGHFPQGSDFVTGASTRLFDSRAGGRPAAGAVQRIKAPEGAVAVAVVLTVTDAAADGFALVYPCGAPVPGVSQVNFRAGQTVANTTIVEVGDDGDICARSNVPAHLIVDTFGTIGARPDLRVGAGARLLDTRATGRVPAQGVVKVSLPDAAAAAVLTVTVTEPEGAGYATAYPCDVPTPGTSTLNYAGGQTVANSAVVPAGASQEICVFTLASAHIVVDYSGFVPPGADFTPGGPSRLLDTRATSRPGAAGWQAVKVPGGSGSALLNLTVDQPQAGGFLTLIPCGSAPSNTSSLNFAAGQIVANQAVAKVGADDQLCVSSNVPTDVIIDHTGSFATGSDFVPLAPQRLLDTRVGARPQPGQEVRVRMPDTATAVAVNVTVTQAAGPGYMQAWPCGAPAPSTSMLNFVGGRDAAAATFVAVGRGQEICLRASHATHIVVDYTGYVTPRTYETADPVRLADTRR